MTKWDLSQGCRIGSTSEKSNNVIHVKRIKKTDIIISIVVEKDLLIKPKILSGLKSQINKNTLNKLEIEGNFINLIIGRKIYS